MEEELSSISRAEIFKEESCFGSIGKGCFGSIVKRSF